MLPITGSAANLRAIFLNRGYTTTFVHSSIASGDVSRSGSARSCSFGLITNSNSGRCCAICRCRCSALASVMMRRIICLNRDPFDVANRPDSIVERRFRNVSFAFSSAGRCFSRIGVNSPKKSPHCLSPRRVWRTIKCTRPATCSKAASLGNLLGPGLPAKHERRESI
jgi:hypothetical protein